MGVIDVFFLAASPDDAVRRAEAGLEWGSDDVFEAKPEDFDLLDRWSDAIGVEAAEPDPLMVDEAVIFEVPAPIVVGLAEARRALADEWQAVGGTNEAFGELVAFAVRARAAGSGVFQYLSP